jgi:hypothetical protein
MEDRPVYNSLLPMLVLLSLLVVNLPLSSADNGSDEFIIDERIQMIDLNPDEPYQQTVQVNEGTIVSVNVGCSSCEVELVDDDTTVTSTSSATHRATESGTVEISISSSINEIASTSFLIAEEQTQMSQRPSPQASIDFTESTRCSQPDLCLNMQRGNLNSIAVGNFSAPQFDIGGVEAGSDEYFGFSVSADEIVELNLHHASDSIRFEFYMQTESDEQFLSQHIESLTGTNPSILQDATYLPIEEDGRIIVKVSTLASFSSYALQRTIHEPQLTMTVDENVSQFVQMGHFSSKSAFFLGETGIVKLAPVIEDISATLSVRIDDNWVMMPEIVVERNTVERIYAYPNTTMAMLTITSTVHWVDVTIEMFTDGNTSIDAPGYLPSTLEDGGWPVLFAENTIDFAGELTLATMDVADVFFISVDGWVDSEHRLHVVIDGNSPNLIAKVSEFDQETMERLQEYPLTPDLFTNDMDLYISVGPGMHLIELYHANESVLSNQTWGNDLPALEYEITITKVTTEIGEEPWFAPSDEAKFWGSAVRWILGLGMMVPAVYLFYSIRRTKRIAEEVGALRERLDLLTKLLDEGKETPQQSRKSLVRSLEAVATLPWDSAITSWGEPRQIYTTDGTSVAVWNLDPRLAKSLGNWPVLVGLNTEKETWEIAAFRFDAPYGQALSVDHVEPRLLHQGEEVFIDTVSKGTTIFLTIDLEGEATQVDIELNGQVDGAPRAMKIPTTLTRFDEEE